MASAVGRLIFNSLNLEKVVLTTKKIIITNNTSIRGIKFISSSSVWLPRLKLIPIFLFGELSQPALLLVVPSLLLMIQLYF